MGLGLSKQIITNEVTLLQALLEHKTTSALQFANHGENQCVSGNPTCQWNISRLYTILYNTSSTAQGVGGSSKIGNL